jgi:hypothetical protein
MLLDEIPLSFIKSLKPVLLGTSTPKVAGTVKFSNYRLISLLACFSKVFDKADRGTHSKK